tara:strand:+ start:568 stop:873 length:306 start_codon:yes stop_codon:yes gene_type:complete
MVSIDKNIITQAYAITQANEYFQSIMDRETIYKLSKELDYVYDLLESLKVYNSYNTNSFKLERDFKVVRGFDKFYIEVGSRVKEIEIGRIVSEVVEMFAKV